MTSPRLISTLQLGLGASRTAMSGTDRYFLDLLRALPANHVAVRGLVAGEPEALDNPVPNVESFAPLNVSRRKRWAQTRKAVRELIRESDLVVSHGAFAIFPVLDIVRQRPLVTQFHGPWALESRAEGRGGLIYQVRRMQEFLNYRQTDRFIVLSLAFGKVLSEQFNIGWENIRVIPGGVALERFQDLPTKDEARRILGWPRDRPIIATVRRLVPSKGVDRLIDAIAQVRVGNPDVLCVIAGKGPEAAKLQKRIDELNLSRNVQLAGYVPDLELPLFYRASDLFVVPTIAFEGFGLAVLEALACGTPAIVTPVGGLGEVVNDLQPDLVLSGCSVRAIAEGIDRVLQSEIRIPSSQECIDYARRFDWNVIAGKIAEVYREVAR